VSLYSTGSTRWLVKVRVTFAPLSSGEDEADLAHHSKMDRWIVLCHHTLCQPGPCYSAFPRVLALFSSTWRTRGKYVDTAWQRGDQPALFGGVATCITVSAHVCSAQAPSENAMMPLTSTVASHGRAKTWELATIPGSKTNVRTP
jgi:hypothetical protein